MSSSLVDAELAKLRSMPKGRTEDGFLYPENYVSCWIYTVNKGKQITSFEESSEEKTFFLSGLSKKATKKKLGSLLGKVKGCAHKSVNGQTLIIGRQNLRIPSELLIKFPQNSFQKVQQFLKENCSSPENWVLICIVHDQIELFLF